jgi:hypothetical protein
MQISIDGKACEVLKQFSEDRLLVSYDGLFAFVDLVNGVYELSGVPARDGAEKEAFAALIAPIDGTTTVTVIRD